MDNPICTGCHFEFNIKDYSKFDYLVLINSEDSVIKEEDIESSSQNQVDSDQTVVSGVVRIFNHDEMMEYQNINPGLLPDMGEAYVVLFAGVAVDVTLLTGGGDGYHINFRHDKSTY